MRVETGMQDTSGGATIDRTAAAWVAGGAVWVAAGAVGADLHGWAFTGIEVLWIVADLFLLAGLLGLRPLHPDGGSRLGRWGLNLAIAGRVVFIAAELVSILSRTDENPLLPLGAVLTAVGMVTFGIAVVRARVWRGVPRVAPLLMGIYPFAVMFPLLAASGGKPSTPAIAGWGATAIVLGVALATRVDATFPRPLSTTGTVATPR